MKTRTSHHALPLAALTLGLICALPAQAALHDRGGGLVYDDVLNVTWLADANYAKTSGYDADGLMNWSAAKTWADNLVYGGFSDWRLPTVLDTGTSGCNFSYGGTDCGFNVQTEAGGTVYSELAYMYHINLGFTSYFSTAGTRQYDSGIYRNGTYGFFDNERDDLGPDGAIDNLKDYSYWSGTTYAPDPDQRAWYFQPNSGGQGSQFKNTEYYAWAVRSGDITGTIPEPETYAMLLAGLGLMGAVVRRRKRQ